MRGDFWGERAGQGAGGRAKRRLRAPKLAANLLFQESGEIADALVHGDVLVRALALAHFARARCPFASAFVRVRALAAGFWHGAKIRWKWFNSFK